MMGSLARDDDYDPFEAEKYASPLVGGLARATGNVISGLARDIPAAGRWFLGQAAKPEAEAQADVRNVMGELAAVPAKAIQNSQFATTTGVYDPAPTMDAALMTMGGGAFGTGERASGAVLGTGPVRIQEPVIAAKPKLRAQADALRGTYPQYAETYPEVGPPALMSKLPDPKNPGKYLIKPGPEVPYNSMEEALAMDAQPGYFLSKKKLPHVEEFADARNTIQKDLDLHGYEPYFDPAKRFDVKGEHYGPFADTGTAAAPATAKTDAEWYAKYGTPENRAKLQTGFTEGKNVPDSANWYHMGQLEQEYIKEYGAKAGRQAFKREFGDMMAATTGGADPYNNFLMSQYANVLAKRGERLATRAYELPAPIGGRYASGNLEQAQKYIDAGMKGFDPAQNPKRYDFSSAFAGNKNASTIDEQMYGALRPATTKESVGLPEWYGPATRVAREEAAKAGVDARGFQDVAWAGLKKGKTGEGFDYAGPMINTINRSIETTHRLTGMPRDEIVRRGLIRKEIPLYAGGDEKAAATAQGIRAYHSSPHDFDKFDLAKIGTGEGAQAYGHGLYFAENPAVSGQGGQYWNQFQPRFKGAEGDAAAFLKKNEFDREKTIDMARQYIKDAEGYYETVKTPLADRAVEHYKNVLHYLENGQPVGPRTYEVNINADPAHMLDWDKPAHQQQQLLEALQRSRSPRVREVAKDESYLNPDLEVYGKNIGPMSGGNLYKGVSYALSGKPGSAEATHAFSRADIPGIKYLDEGSRGPSMQAATLRAQLQKPNWLPEMRAEMAAKLAELEKTAPTSNYVIFDPAKIRIDKKYGIAGAAAPLGALAATDAYQPRGD